MSTGWWWARSPASPYGESQLGLETGDLLVCFTDGITEPENAYGEMFGEERLIELVQAQPGARRMRKS